MHSFNDDAWGAMAAPQSCKLTIEKTRRDKSVSTTLTEPRPRHRRHGDKNTDLSRTIIGTDSGASVALGPATDRNCGEIGLNSCFYIQTEIKRHFKHLVYETP